jgi:hypothetical protein
MGSFGGPAKSDCSFVVTTMSEYDFQPGGSLRLKRTAEDGKVKKYAFIYSLISFI